jgi:hypothetical protein
LSIANELQARLHPLPVVQCWKQCPKSPKVQRVSLALGLLWLGSAESLFCPLRAAPSWGLQHLRWLCLMSGEGGVAWAQMGQLGLPSLLVASCVASPSRLLARWLTHPGRKCPTFSGPQSEAISLLFPTNKSQGQLSPHQRDGQQGQYGW